MANACVGAPDLANNGGSGTSPTASYTSSPAQRLLSVLAPVCSAERRVDNASGSDLMPLRVDLGVAGRRAGLPGG
jgi:hypothetical protein